MCALRAIETQPAFMGGKPIRERNRYLVFGRPAIGEEEIAEVVDTLRSGWIGTGPKVARFETEFARYIGVEHAVAVSSCTAALHLAIQASGIGPGDEVITTPMTFCATLNAILHTGAVPVLADCDANTGNLDPEQVARRITKQTRAILPVHLAGRACDMTALRRLADEHGLALVEDCAHAIETKTGDGKHVGTHGQAGAFSFYVTKNLVTAEGGMLVTNDAEFATRVKVMALHGMSVDAWKRFSDDGYQHYDVVGAGFKFNMTDIQASLGLHQLAKIEAGLVRREAIWRRYDEAFADLPLETPLAPEPGTRHARHLYTVLLERDRWMLSRDRFLTALHAEGIGTGVHYRAISEHAFYRKQLHCRLGDFRVAEDIGRRTLSLPLSPGLSDEDVEDVITAVRRIAAACSVG